MRKSEGGEPYSPLPSCGVVDSIFMMVLGKGGRRRGLHRQTFRVHGREGRGGVKPYYMGEMGRESVKGREYGKGTTEEGNIVKGEEI